MCSCLNQIYTLLDKNVVFWEKISFWERQICIPNKFGLFKGMLI